MLSNKALVCLLPLSLLAACATGGAGNLEGSTPSNSEHSTVVPEAPFAGVDLSRRANRSSAATPGNREGGKAGTGLHGIPSISPSDGSFRGSAPVVLPRTSLSRELRTTTLRGFQSAESDSLRGTVDQVALLTGLPLIVSGAAEQAAFDEGALFEYTLSNRITAHNLLNLIASDAGDGVEWVLQHEAVVFTTRERARGELAIRVHDISGHVFAQTDFLAPRIDRLRLLEDIEDDDGGGLFGGVGESVQRYTESDLETLVQENIAVGTWDDEGVSIRGENGKLIVVHSDAVQLQVRRFLDELSPF